MPPVSVRRLAGVCAATESARSIRVAGRGGLSSSIAARHKASHVAIVAGWGGRPEWMARAQTLGCDTFLTGEALMFGPLFAKEAGMNLIVAGHYATEAPGVMALSTRIACELTLDVTFIPEEIIEVTR